MILKVCKSNHQLIGNPFKWWKWGWFSLFGPSCNQCKAMPFWGYPPCPTTEGMWAGLEMPYPGSGWLLPQHCHQPMVQQSGWVEASFRKEGPGNRKLLISLATYKYISIGIEIYIYIYICKYYIFIIIYVYCVCRFLFKRRNNRSPRRLDPARFERTVWLMMLAPIISTCISDISSNFTCNSNC